MTQPPENPTPEPGKRRVVTRGPSDLLGKKPLPAEALYDHDPDPDAQPRSLADDMPRDLSEMPVRKERRYKVPIPKKHRLAPEDPALVILRELTDEQLDMARAIGKKKGDHSNASEGVKMSMVVVDGHPVNHMEDEASLLWARWSAKVHHLMLAAWANIHAVPEDETTDFLAQIEPI